MAITPLIPDSTREALFRAGEESWQNFRTQRGAAFHAFVPGDYAATYEVLRRLRSRADSFLELGSGVGVITIMASLLGFDAAGIEIDPWLVEAAQSLADEFGTDSAFANGSFIPTEFCEEVDRHQADAEIPTVLEGVPAYPDLGMDLDEFDAVYSYHWPGLEDLFFELMRRHGRPGGWFLTFGGLNGLQVWREGSRYGDGGLGALAGHGVCR